MPVEIMARRGADTLRYGPLRPVGLVNPATGHRPWANVQLRSEDWANSRYNLVGFQTNLKFGEQKRVSYTHLDVYKRQVPSSSAFPPSVPFETKF